MSQMRPIRLLHLADTADRGGGETYLSLLADRLPRDRYAFSVFCPSEGLLPQRLRKIGVHGVSEVVEDGVTALLVPPQVPETLAQAAITLLSNRPLGSRLGAAARQQAERRFGLERMVQEVETLYKELLGHRASCKESQERTPRDSREGDLPRCAGFAGS